MGLKSRKSQCLLLRRNMVTGTLLRPALPCRRDLVFPIKWNCDTVAYLAALAAIESLRFLQRSEGYIGVL
jgi:hypothetical protein